MNFAVGKVALSAVFILLIIVASYFITTNRNGSVFCSYTDPLLCDFLSNVTSETLIETAGTYEEFFENKKISAVSWSLQKDGFEIVHKDPQEEQMHFIKKNDSIYLKDYTDNKWWKQSTKDSASFDYKLPFDPSLFQKNIISYVNNKDLKIEYRGEDICLGEECSVYEFINNSGQASGTKLYISKDSSRIRRVIFEVDGVVQDINIFIKNAQFEAPKDNLKTADKSTNIFLRNFLERSKTVSPLPEHILEIQQNIEDTP